MAEVIEQPAPVEEPKARRKPGPKPKTPEASIGRIVRYVTDTGAERAAIITEVHEDNKASLVVFNHLGAFPVTAVSYDADGMESSWSWPPRD